MELLNNLFTPLTPWFITWSTAGAFVVGGFVGLVEAFYEYKLKRPPPWPRLLP